MKCPYCDKPADLVTGAVIYPHRPDLASGKFYRCLPCKAWVGCHKKTAHPFGRLANAELRWAKRRAHQMFDPLWQSGEMSREQAYNWLGKCLGLPKHACHIGMFDVDRCDLVIQYCRERRKETAR